MPSRSDIKKIMMKVDKAFRTKEASFGSHSREVYDDGEEYDSVGVDGILAASENLLAVNKGLRPPDERDSLQFKKTMRTHSLMADRIRLDAGKLRKSLMNRAAKQRNLKSLHSFYFDPYIEGQLIGNPLSAPLEEINPMQLVEQARRLTLMGPGGLGSSQAITSEAQALNPSTFGFLSTLEGPESSDALTWVYTKLGWKRWPEITMEDELACCINGTLEFHRPEKLFIKPFKGNMVLAEHSNVRMCVTPNHRIVYTKHKKAEKWTDYKVDFAEHLKGQNIRVPCWHNPYEGSNKITEIEVPGMGVVSVVDYAAFLGWYLSEGNISAEDCRSKYVCITQCSVANPENFCSIEDLLNRMGLKYSYRKYPPSHKNYGFKNGFILRDKALNSYLLDFIPGGRLCHEKGFPEDILEWSVEARRACLEALMNGDGRQNATHNDYCSTSRALADGVERLVMSLGLTCRLREEVDKRAHVTTTNWVVSILKVKEKSIWGSSYGHAKYPGKIYGAHWKDSPYDGLVYSARVPGGFVFIRGSESTQGFWSGNSERIGIDTRVSWGAKLGSDGRIYQKFRDKRTGRMKWMSAQDLDGLTIKLPD